MTAKTKKRIRNWGRLLTGLLLMWAFVYVVAPACKNIEAVDTYTTYVRESGINASALWWSEVEETADAEFGARSVVEYTPRPFEKD